MQLPFLVPLIPLSISMSCHSPFTWKTSFNISYSVVCWWWSIKAFVFWRSLDFIFVFEIAGFSFPFSTLKTFLPCLLTWLFLKMYLRSCLSLFLVCNASFFPLWWLLRFLPLSLVLSNLKTMRLGVYFFPMCLELGIHGASWTWEFIDHFKFGNISIIISSNILFVLFLTSIPSTSWTYMYTLGCLELFYSSLKPCSFLLLIFF